MLTLRAPAKVNLTLEVLGRRDDGYHDIVSIMQTVDLCDTLTIEPADALTIDCDDASIDPPENLALRLAEEDVTRLMPLLERRFSHAEVTTLARGTLLHFTNPGGTQESVKGERGE